MDERLSTPSLLHPRGSRLCLLRTIWQPLDTSEIEIAYESDRMVAGLMVERGYGSMKDHTMSSPALRKGADG